MKRVVISILLLVVALFISKPFVAEPSQLSVVSGEQSSIVIEQTFFKPTLSETPQILTAGCPCDTPYTNPTISLVIVAAVAACLAMASFIYGSHFIAGLVAG